MMNKTILNILFIVFLFLPIGLKAQTYKIKSPVFGGSYTAFLTYVSTNLETSIEAKQAGFIGEVKVVFRVNVTGIVDSVFVEGTDNYNLIEPIKYLLTNSDGYSWGPAKRNGQNVIGIMHEVFTFNSNMNVFVPPREFILDYTVGEPFKLTTDAYLGGLKLKLEKDFKKNKRLIKKKSSGLYVCKLFKTSKTNLILKLIKGQGLEINKLVENVIEKHNQLFEIVLDNAKNFNVKLIIDFSSKRPLIKFDFL